jgi:hypothetical protein
MSLIKTVANMPGLNRPFGLSSKTRTLAVRVSGSNIWFVCIAFFLASLLPAGAAEHTAVFANETLSLSDAVVGEVKDGRSLLSLPGLIQILGAPSRTAIHGQTQRITWDSDGVQLEATNPESTPFAVLFSCTPSDAASQGIVPSAPYNGTLDFMGIRLRSGQSLTDEARVLTGAGFAKDPNSAQTWSLQLAHWAVYLRFTRGVIDSVVIRILPDIY